MKYIEIICAAGSANTISALASKVGAADVRLGLISDDDKQSFRLLVANHQLQETLDGLQMVLGAQPEARITVLAVETALPKADEAERKETDKAVTARENLYEQVAQGARLTGNYLLLVVLSTVVAAIGLLENNIAVVIGAMVIAPLLGPNLALSLGSALGDLELMFQAVKTFVSGVLLVLTLSFSIGLIWPDALNSDELLLRTKTGWDTIALALASGAAAALSLTTGLSSVLVGVMVAVALLPPAATIGLMLGGGNYSLAGGAALLLAINIVCVNLASKLVFLSKGVHPRTWLEKSRATKATRRYLAVWVITLILLTAAMLVINNLKLTD